MPSILGAILIFKPPFVLDFVLDRRIPIRSTRSMDNLLSDIRGDSHINLGNMQ